MIHYHHHHHLIHHISGEAPLSANPPEVWLDLSDLLQEKNQLTTLTSPYTKQVETENDTAIIVSSDDNKNGGHSRQATYANSYVDEIGILSDRALTNILVRTIDNVNC